MTGGLAGVSALACHAGRVRHATVRLQACGSHAPCQAPKRPRIRRRRGGAAAARRGAGASTPPFAPAASGSAMQAMQALGAIWALAASHMAHCRSASVHPWSARTSSSSDGSSRASDSPSSRRARLASFPCASVSITVAWSSSHAASKQAEMGARSAGSATDRRNMGRQARRGMRSGAAAGHRGRRQVQPRSDRAAR